MYRVSAYFIEGFKSAFVTSHRAPVQPVEPAKVDQENVSEVGNAANYWEITGKRMTSNSKVICKQMGLKCAELK